jgi:hypothetical protein
MKALLIVLGPSAFPALALEHADHEAARRVHHAMRELGLSPAFASPIFAGLRAGKFVAAEIVHRTHPATGESLSFKVNICSMAIGHGGTRFKGTIDRSGLTLGAARPFERACARSIL